MKNATAKSGICVLVLAMLGGTLCVSAAEKTDAGPRKFDWVEKTYFTGTRPERLGILVVTYLGFADKNGQKTYLKPKLSGDIASKDSAQWLGYVPQLAEGSIQKLVESAVIDELRNTAKQYGDTVVRSIEKGQSVKQGLAAFGDRDAYIVICMEEPEARLLVLGGTASAIAQTKLDCVLVGKALNPVATTSVFALEPLQTIGKLDKKYGGAHPFGESTVEFRYTREALVKALVPSIIGIAKEPCLAAFVAMKKAASK